MAQLNKTGLPLHFRLYGREDCHLCEVLEAELRELCAARGVEIEHIDIADSADLQRRFGLRIPVLIFNGEEVCQHRLDHSRIHTILELS